LREDVYIETAADAVRNEVPFIPCRAEQFSSFSEPTPHSDTVALLVWTCGNPVHSNEPVLDGLVIWNLANSFEFGIEVENVFERPAREAHDICRAGNRGHIQIEPIERKVLPQMQDCVWFQSCIMQQSFIIEHMPGRKNH